jgi:peptidoglycan/xylan/chitin deacetylase (PgdA/CDA1 family)
MRWLVNHRHVDRARVRRVLLCAAQSALYLSGVGALFLRTRSPEGAMILMYHGIVRPHDAPWIDPRFSVSVSTFEAQMRFLRRRRHVMSMTELVDKIERRDAISPGTVVITFDDGYRSTLEIAAPILKRYDLPAVVYLATGYVARGQAQFIDTLFSAFEQRTRHVLNLPTESLESPADLRDSNVSRRVYLALAHRLMVSGIDQRERLLAEVIDQLRPRDRAPRLTLTWEEVARLRRFHPRFEIGVHTKNHIDLTSCTPAVVSSEVLGSAEDVRRELGADPAHFSYPFGRSNEHARAAVARAMLRSAAVTEPATLARSGADLLGLPRLTAPGTMGLFPFYTSGAYPDLSHKVLGRA